MNRQDIAKIIQEHITYITKNELQKDSFEWYLHNHLRNLLNLIKNTNNSHNLLEEGKKFIMFCTDSMDWDDDNYKKLISFGDMATKIAKNELSKKL